MNKNEILDQDYSILITDLKKRVAESRYRATLSVNKEMVLLYHHILHSPPLAVKRTGVCRGALEAARDLLEAARGL